MAVPLLDLKAQHATIRSEVLEAIMPIVDGQTFILGEPVQRLERSVAELSRTKHAIGCANGTDAILLALRALDVGHGDSVVTTPFTFFATAGAIHNVGARPVFADIDPETFNISVQEAADAVSRTRGARPSLPSTSLARWPPSTTSLRHSPTGYRSSKTPPNRSAHDARSTAQWVVAGEIATIGTFSFFPSKNLGGYGDGGMIVTQDDALGARLMRLRTHGSVRTYFHEEVGYNSRLDALQAAVLLAKLPHLSSWSAARRRNAELYNKAFADLDGVRTPVIDPRNESIYNQYTLRARRRDELQALLARARDR